MIRMAEQPNSSHEAAAAAGKEMYGKVELAPEVLEVIVGIATAEVEGVADMRGSFATGVAEKLGRKVHGKGVKIDYNDDGLFIDVYCSVGYGRSVPSVAREIQKNVRQSVFNMTAIEPEEVNVHITGIQFDQTEERA
ncbi:hypothetical protein C772_01206 [Bhargavaea cecembensis DSE10]|uniref:Alkaline shock protein 23 n=2 Tax=Bhargavaea cecembensis TaxID=394098 RepID=M7NDN3_9BACL|nr:hypothetical protein C772_01206 [Bhargavaea cecembensis DSE10]